MRIHEWHPVEAIIFKHYHELTTDPQADAWFSILPKDGQWENAHDYDKKKRVVTLHPADTH